MFQFKYDTITQNFVKCFQNIKENTSGFIAAVVRVVNIISYRQKLIYTGISFSKKKKKRIFCWILVSQIFCHAQKVARSDGSFWEIAYRLFWRWEQHCLFFQSFGNVPLSKHQLKLISRGLQIKVLQSFSILMFIWSWPWALLGSKFRIIFTMSSVEKVIDDKPLCVKYWSWLGTSLLLLIREQWFSRKKFKSSVFFP